jgi:hypothetical protein
MSFDMSNYTTVNDRLLELFAKYPEARIQNSEPRVVLFDGREWWLVTTKVWRDPADPLPVIASAAEPKGSTPYTRDSEMMNAETSAIGRAILLIGGIGIKPGGGMASRNEVQNRQTADKPRENVAQLAGPRTFPNKFAKACVHCGDQVPAGDGVSWKDGDTYKTAHRDGECDLEPPF